MTFTLQDAQRKELRLEAKLNKINGLLDEKVSRKKLRRLDKITNRLEEIQKELAFLETQRDEVSYKVFERDGITGVEVTITDSIFDETFTNGNRVSLQLRGTKVGGGKRFGTIYGLRFEEPTDTFLVAGNQLSDRLDGSYEVTASLLQDGQPVLTETLI